MEVINLLPAIFTAVDHGTIAANLETFSLGDRPGGQQ